MPRAAISTHDTPARRRDGFDITITGAVFVVMTGFMVLAAMVSQANLLYAVFGLMVGILIVSWWVNRAVLRKLTMKRGLPEGAVVGVPTLITCELRNGKRYWPSFSVTVSELDGVNAFTRQPHAYLLHAAAKTTATVPAMVVPRRRGLYELDRYQLSSSFPFGFMKRATNPEKSRHREAIVVYPPIAAVDQRLLQLMRSAERTGTTIRPRRGGTDEFYGLKEFRPGENPRYIYWRRSARTGTLVLKEMTQVAPPKIIVLVDTFLANADDPERRAARERSIAMAASLASHALEQGLSVGLVAWSNEWIKLAPARGKRHRRDVLAVLARLPSNVSQNAQAVVEAAREFQEDSTTTVLFSAADVAAPSRTGGFMTISPDSMQAARWFRFGAEVDFLTCAPIEESESTRRQGDKATGRAEGGVA